MEFFAANRRGHEAGRPWELLRENPFNERTYGFLTSHRGDFSADDIARHVNMLYPDGLSPHGWGYMTIRFGSPLLQGGGCGLPNEPIMELIFEYVRRTDYADRPSRLQSFFAYDSLEKAKQEFPNTQIVRFVSEHHFRCDQTWLNVSHQIAVAEFNAHRYWSGDASSTPEWEFLITPPFVPEIVE